MREGTPQRSDRDGRHFPAPGCIAFLSALFLFLSGTGLRAARPPVPGEGWTRMPADWKEAAFAGDTATLTARKWSFLTQPAARADVEVSAVIRVREAGKLKSYFGEFWSVWPDKSVDDQGWDAGLLLRAGDASGYRVQVSASLGEVALVKYPAGGYVRSVPVAIRTNAPLALVARVRGNRVAVEADGREVLSFVDADPLPAGRIGIGVHSGARVEFSQVAVKASGAAKPEGVPAHAPNFRARRWLGGRQWVFDGDEPILLLPDPASSFINSVKLRPGVRPLLGFNSHWDVQNQGANPEAKNDTADVRVAGGGRELAVSWVGRHEKGRFATRTRMTVGWDPQRSVYAYDLGSELEVLPGEPFHFRYGFDFEHHTPLDPFNWQYLVFRQADGTLNRRPVYPVDPGTQNGLEASSGWRVWQGRHNDPVPVCPAVEYRIDAAGGRKLNTAVCAAFYDTGVSFPAETLKPGQKVAVRYRYTGYPADEAAALFRQAKTYPSPMLDPDHHYIFAEWPRTTFAQFAALSDTWVYGRVPFMTGHNQRPSYTLARAPGTESGYAMTLGPLAFGAAPLPIPAGGLEAGRYVLSVKAMGDHLIGPGGRIELTAADPGGKPLLAVRHFVGAGSFGWRQAGLALDLPAGVKTLTLGFGNGGTGSVSFGDAEIRRLPPGDPLPPGLAAAANATPAKMSPAPAGALLDYRMVEGRGLHALDFADGPVGPLELANAGWSTDDGRPALVFRDHPGGPAVFPKAGGLDSSYLRHPSYQGRETVPVAVAGHHGRDGIPLPGFTVVTWVKPAPETGRSDHRGTGDIVGIGARRVVLRLVGERAPYRLQGSLDRRDSFTTAEPVIEAGRWFQVALTGEPTPEGPWRVRLYLDGRVVQQGLTAPMAAPLTIAPSVVLGTDLFYFHNAYYRGLIGRTLLFNRPLSAADLAGLKAGG